MIGLSVLSDDFHILYDNRKTKDKNSKL
jgi:hypothetical protein